jgi:hypothetical protein
VADLFKRGEGSAADTLGRGVRGNPLRMLALQGLQFAVKRIIIRIANLWSRLYIIESIMPADLIS